MLLYRTQLSRSYQSWRISFWKRGWQINVQGQSPDGSTARIEVMETKCLDVGY